MDREEAEIKIRQIIGQDLRRLATDYNVTVFKDGHKNKGWAGHVIEPAIKEFCRVLKPDHYCAILIGDTRRKRHFVPIAYNVMTLFMKNGFILKEDIIKVQYNCQATPKWRAMVGQYDFYLIMHEHLFVFRKSVNDEDMTTLKESRIIA